MHIVYLVSRYPNLSETFIAREMEQLAKLGHEIVICRLKWVTPWTSKEGLQVSQARLMKPQFNPLLWTSGLLWAFKHKRTELKSIWHDFKQAAGRPTTRLKLLTILLTTLPLAQRLDHQGVNHIRAHFLHSEAVAAMWLGRLLNIQHSLTAQTTEMLFPEVIVQKTIRTAAFCAATTFETMGLLAAIRRSKEGLHLIRSGVDMKQFAISDPITVKPQPPVLLAVARLVKKKGLDLLIQACALLREWGVDYTCQIVGNGPEYTALRDLIQTLELDGRVSLVGPLPFCQVKTYYQNASVAVLPCRASTDAQDTRDGLPNVLIEALALKVPVVATDFAGIPDLIIHRQTGLLVPPENVTELAKTLHEILTDDNLRASLAKAGRKKVEREFDMVKSAQQLEAAILQTIRSNEEGSR